MGATENPQNKSRLLLAAILGAGLGFLGSSIVNVALPTFQTELSADATDIQWIVSAFNLALAGLLLNAGAISDRRGHLVTFRLGLITYGCASIVCAMAWTAEVLIVGRALQGLGSALLIPSSLGLVNTAHAAHERGRAVGLWSSYSAVVGGTAPLIAGVLLAITSWRYLFWINVPIAIVVWRLLDSSNIQVPEVRPAKVFDWFGACFSVLALGFLTFAAIESSTLGLRNPIVLLSLGSGLAAGYLFIRSQGRSAHPLMPLDMFHSRNFSAANIVTFLAYSSMGGGFYVMMLTWIQIQGYSPLAAGAITLPFMLFTAGLAHPIANLVRRIGPRLPLATGVLLLGLGFMSFSFAEVGTNFWTGYLPGILLSALGIALIVAPLTTVIMGSVDVSQSGTASGINSAVARTAILLSVGILGAIHIAQFESTASNALVELNLDAALEVHMHAELINMAAANIPHDIEPELQNAIHTVIVDSFMHAALVVTRIAGALSILGALIAFLAIGRLPREETTEPLD